MFDTLRHSKATLLVGEGNFSFTMALIKSIEPLPMDCRVVSTSYESKEICLAKYGKVDCEKNIEYLLANNVKVIHGVDATDISATISMEFDVIIFQFPHTGRKSSIKKNRNLLLKFFGSAKNILHQCGGIIIVTLCAGQGGTPADSVVREKCNSWQIVEMAAASDFILREVKAFDASNYSGYVSTGRRNWNNSFITSMAMSHKFSLGEKLPCFQRDWVVFEKNLQCLPSALDMRIKMVENFPESTLLHSVTKSIIRRLGCPDHYIQDVIKTQCVSSAAYGIMMESINDDGVNVIDKVMEIHANQNVDFDNSIAYHFASCFHKEATTEGILANFDYDIVFVSYRGAPILRQFKNALMNHCSHDFEISIQPLPDQSAVVKQESHNICIYSSNPHCGRIIGKSFEIKSMTVYQISMVEVILSIRKDLTDKRMFWTLNTDAVSRMKKSLLENFTYSPASIYPTDYHHDISFWVYDCHESDKHAISSARLATLVSLIADEAFHCIELLEKYVNDGKMSMLYRITYRSLHYALSRQQCSKLQLDVRTYIEQFFNVQSR